MEKESGTLFSLLRKPIARRDFLVGMGVLVGGAVLASSLLGQLIPTKAPELAGKEEGRLGLRQGPVSTPPESSAR
ncbi:MAG: hypothetical protein NTV14_04320 [Coprothermobacterota bacterium]|nr:hypothetical protein [Coprothermobacterota bacterium]